MIKRHFAYQVADADYLYRSTRGVDDKAVMSVQEQGRGRVFWEVVEFLDENWLEVCDLDGGLFMDEIVIEHILYCCDTISAGSYSFCMDLLVHEWRSIDTWGLVQDSWSGIWDELHTLAWMDLWSQGGYLRLLY